MGDIKDWFGFEGALGKKDYIVRILAALAVGMLLGWLPVVGWGVGLVCIYVNVCSVKRRLVTLGQNPWWTLLLLVPLVNFALVIGLMIRGK